ncbi:hypothetical protein ACRALDRAFT_205147 [Sodiomyces alcalophilus JCM 7366]|uniref:uncharacterized protein n=1 Tax=Sodiomyces alcalophilus JCM 7366 TaxID=591952 RepID=UPI0039B46E8F
MLAFPDIRSRTLHKVVVQNNAQALTALVTLNAMPSLTVIKLRIFEVNFTEDKRVDCWPLVSNRIPPPCRRTGLRQALGTLSLPMRCIPLYSLLDLHLDGEYSVRVQARDYLNYSSPFYAQAVSRSLNYFGSLSHHIIVHHRLLPFNILIPALVYHTITVYPSVPAVH